MKPTSLKVLLLLNQQESSLFSEGGFNEAYDCHLVDVKSLVVGIQNMSGTLRKVAERAPDVLLIDSTLAWQFVLKMAIRLRDQMPRLPIVLLPNTADAGDGLKELPEFFPKGLPGSERSGGARVAGDSIARIIRYIHGRLELQRTLLQMALRDDLTGLHNRRGFMALATQHLIWARDMGQPMLMFFADVDGLKWINDEFGHAEGDRAISLAAAGIQQTFRKSDVTGHLSGDEFVAMIIEEPGRDAEAIGQRLQMNLANCSRAETRYKLSLSVGVAHFNPDKPISLHELMKQADAAMYRQRGYQRFRVPETVSAANLRAGAREGGSIKRGVLPESAALTPRAIAGSG